MSADTLEFAFSGALSTTYYGRAWVYVDAFASAGQTAILIGFLSGGTLGANLRVDDSGNVGLYSGITLIGSTTPISLNTWTLLEVGTLIGTGSIDTAEGRVGGVSFASGSGLAITDAVPTLFVFCSAGNGQTMYADDIALNDSTGASQTSWPGDGRAALLKPISDNAVAAGWTNDANAATNLWDAVNNTPPVGIADTTSGTGLNQIRDATTGANEAYDANMTSYATAGIASGDTINVIVPQIATGAPVTTSAKTGSVGVVSNPTIAQLNFTDGGKVDTFWAGAAAATYPTGWKWSPGNTDYASSVTLGTSPVMRVQQIDSSTRIAMVCAMGMYVDYTPAATGTVYTKAGHGVEHG